MLAYGQRRASFGPVRLISHMESCAKLQSVVGLEWERVSEDSAWAASESGGPFRRVQQAPAVSHGWSQSEPVYSRVVSQFEFSCCCRNRGAFKSHEMRPGAACSNGEGSKWTPAC